MSRQRKAEPGKPLQTVKRKPKTTGSASAFDVLDCHSFNPSFRLNMKNADIVRKII